MAQKQLGIYAERIGPIYLLQPDTNLIDPIHYVIVHQLYSKLACMIQIYGSQCRPSIIEQCINQTKKWLLTPPEWNSRQLKETLRVLMSLSHPSLSDYVYDRTVWHLHLMFLLMFAIPGLALISSALIFSTFISTFLCSLKYNCRVLCDCYTTVAYNNRRFSPHIFQIHLISLPVWLYLEKNYRGLHTRSLY